MPQRADRTIWNYLWEVGREERNKDAVETVSESDFIRRDESQIAFWRGWMGHCKQLQLRTSRQGCLPKYLPIWMQASPLLHLLCSSSCPLLICIAPFADLIRPLSSIHPSRSFTPPHFITSVHSSNMFSPCTFTLFPPTTLSLSPCPEDRAESEWDHSDSVRSSRDPSQKWKHPRTHTEPNTHTRTQSSRNTHHHSFPLLNNLQAFSKYASSFPVGNSENSQSWQFA